MRPLAFICLLGCNLGLLGSVFAYEPLLPLSKPVVQPSFAPVVKKVAPAVVNVMTTRSLSGAAFAPLMADPFFKQYFDYQKELNTAPEAPASLGSGVIVRADGIVITNYHVIQVGSEINVILADGRTFGASIVSVDSKTDLAAIKIDAPKGTVFPFLSLYDADALEVGDTVLAIGNPFGVGQSVTSGIVSALSRTQAGGSDFRAFI